MLKNQDSKHFCIYKSLFQQHNVHILLYKWHLYINIWKMHVVFNKKHILLSLKTEEILKTCKRISSCVLVYKCLQGKKSNLNKSTHLNLRQQLRGWEYSGWEGVACIRAGVNYDQGDSLFLGELIFAGGNETHKDTSQRNTHWIHRGQKICTCIDIYWCHLLSYYLHLVVTCITMNEELTGTKIYLTKVHNVFAFRKLLVRSSHITTD